MKKIIEGSNSETEVIDSLENIKVENLSNKEFADEIFESFEKNNFSLCLKQVKNYLDSFNDNFYEMTFIYIYCLNKLDQKDKALEILKEELSMPYIPQEFEEKYLNLYNEIRPKDNKSKQHLLNDEQIKNILLNEEKKDLIFAVIMELNSLNARKYLFLIQEFLLRKVKNIYKVMLIEVLKNQFVNHEFKYVNNNNEYKINPINSVNILESENYSKIIELLNDKLGVKFPDLFNLSQEVTMLYISEIWPDEVKGQKVKDIAKAVKIYIDKLFEIDNDYDANLQDNNDIQKIIDLIEIACQI